jgi:hypothetical protein
MFSSLLFQKSFSQQLQKRPTTSLYKFGLEINNGDYFSGIKALSYDYMRIAFPSDTYTDLQADIEKLTSQQLVQDRFMYCVYRNNGSNNEGMAQMLYLLSKDATTSKNIANYYFSKFKYPC